MFVSPKIARPSCEIPDSVLFGTTLYACASTVMPTNIPIASVAIVTSVAEAFFASGGRRQRYFDRHDGAGEIPIQPRRQQQRNADHEKIGWHRKDVSRLPDAAQ